MTYPFFVKGDTSMLKLNPCTTLDALMQRLKHARCLIEATSEVNAQERMDAEHAVDVAMLALTMLCSRREGARADSLVSNVSSTLTTWAAKGTRGDTGTRTT